MTNASGDDEPGSPTPEPPQPEQPPAAPPPPPQFRQPPPFQQPPPPYGQPYPPPGYPVQRAAQLPRFNGWAIAGFVCGFFVHVLGLVFGLIALTEINRNGQRGRGLAIAGIAIGGGLLLLSLGGAIAGWVSFGGLIGPFGRW